MLKALTAAVSTLALAACATTIEPPPPMAPAMQPGQPHPWGMPVVSAETNVVQALERIDRLNPALHAVIAVDPSAVTAARAFDSSGAALGLVA